MMKDWAEAVIAAALVATFIVWGTFMIIWAGGVV